MDLTTNFSSEKVNALHYATNDRNNFDRENRPDGALSSLNESTILYFSTITSSKNYIETDLYHLSRWFDQLNEDGTAWKNGLHEKAWFDEEPLIYQEQKKL